MPEEKSRETVGIKSTSRRKFLNHIGSGAVTMAALTATGQTEGLTPQGVASGSDLIDSVTRAAQAFRIREQAARRELLSPVADHPDNGDEQRYPDKIGSYSKGLPHNRFGEVDLQAYRSLLAALNSGKSLDFEDINMGLGAKLTNPQAGLAFEMEGPDSHALTQRPAPAFSSPEEASEIAENYWMALARDIPFADYETSPLVQDAARDLSRFSDFKGPNIGGQVTSKSLFRGNTPGDLTGPFISQFLWMDT